jgi:hypothetical protein
LAAALAAAYAAESHSAATASRAVEAATCVVKVAVTAVEAAGGAVQQSPAKVKAIVQLVAGVADAAAYTARLAATSPYAAADTTNAAWHVETQAKNAACRARAIGDMPAVKSAQDEVLLTRSARRSSQHPATSASASAPHAERPERPIGVQHVRPTALPAAGVPPTVDARAPVVAAFEYKSLGAKRGRWDVPCSRDL